MVKKKDRKINQIYIAAPDSIALPVTRFHKDIRLRKATCVMCISITSQISGEGTFLLLGEKMCHADMSWEDLMPINQLQHARQIMKDLFA